MKRIVRQPIALILGSDNKPARVRVVYDDGETAVTTCDVWLSPSAFERLSKDIKFNMMTAGSEEWVFHNVNRLPLLDMWGNIVQDGLHLVTNYDDSGNHIVQARGNSLFVRDTHGYSKCYAAETLASVIQRDISRKLFCNLDYDTLQLTQNDLVLNVGDISSDIDLLTAQSSCMKFSYAANGALYVVRRGMQDKQVAIPTNWTDLRYYDERNPQLEVVTFPADMYRLHLSLIKCPNIKKLVLPEIMHLPEHFYESTVINIRYCNELEELDLPACRGVVSVQVHNCPKLRVIKSKQGLGYIAQAQLTVLNCPNLSGVYTPNYAYTSFAVDNKEHPSVSKYDDVPLCISEFRGNEIVTLSERGG